MATAFSTTLAGAAPATCFAAAGQPAARVVSVRASAKHAVANASASFSAVRSIAPGALALKAAAPVARASASRMVVQASRFDHSERTYIMIKPDGVQRGLVGDIISRFERKGFVLKGLKTFECPKELAEEHYKDLSDKPFFGDLVEYICSGPVVCMVWQGYDVVKSARKLIGATNPLESEPGTIRGDFAVEVGRNVIHGSDSPENGEREIGLWFADEAGLVDWEPTILPWVRE